MGQEEAAVVAVAARGDAGNDLPQFSFLMIFHFKSTLTPRSFRLIGLSHGLLISGSRLLRTKLEKEEIRGNWIRLLKGSFPSVRRFRNMGMCSGLT